MCSCPTGRFGHLRGLVPVEDDAREAFQRKEYQVAEARPAGLDGFMVWGCQGLALGVIGLSSGSATREAERARTFIGPGVHCHWV